MGIPMYRGRDEAPKCDNTKDASAIARSAIRRQASARDPSTRRHRSNIHQAPYRPPLPRSVIEEIERQVGGLNSRVFSPAIDSSPAVESFDTRGAPADLNSHEAEERAPDSAINYYSLGRQVWASHETDLSDLRDPPRRDGSSMNQQNSDAAPFTHRFAPAFAFHSTIPTHLPRNAARLLSLPRLDSPGDETGSHVPQLSRTGRRLISESHRPNRGSVVDGLGDRQRSLSPDDDYEIHPWETLLTTITPDANLPSADSSFNSASVSTSDFLAGRALIGSSNSHLLGPRTSATHIVVEPYTEYLNPCDNPASSDSETETEQVSSHPAPRRESRTSLNEHSRRSHIHSTMSNHPPIPTVSLVRPDSPSYHNNRHHLQHVLDQLVRGENISDFVWTTAGLSYPASRRTGTSNASHDMDGADGPVSQRIR